LLRPIALLKEGAERISCGELDYRVAINQTDELGTLTNSINQMADSLNAMLEAKQQLLLGISHELRTPITRVKIQLAMMEPGSILEEECKQSLLEDVDELDMLVSDLLEAERLNSQHAGLNREVIDAGEVTREIVEQHWQGNVLINYITSKHIAAPERVALDKLRYKLLVRNLVSNALKYGDAKPIEVKVFIDLNQLVLTISDKGEGISEEHIKRITEPFYRADNARQRQTGGFGLGLYLCLLIVEAYNGKLEISSAIGQGTQIVVALPNK
jgi:signal transduction histidine kinase